MGYYNNRCVMAERGELCGLDSKDLTAKQLEKIWSSKLIEFVRSDGRAKKVLANRVRNCSDEKIISIIECLSNERLNELK